ncbi:MAG: putative glycoside hydrolase [Oscillospiraceae bacterium]|nr:putative glycoside hydrolase [Oscillospiraceae bacterium]MDY2510188.1 putative glycoside hydrolase [Ruminococcus callidus]
MKRKSPKIYKVKTGKMKSATAHNVLSAVVMIAAAGLVGFVGYSVAKPFIDDGSSVENNADLQMNATVTTTSSDGISTDFSATVTTLSASGSAIETDTIAKTTASTTTKTAVQTSTVTTAETEKKGTAATTKQTENEQNTTTQAVTTEVAAKNGVSLSNFTEADTAEWLSASVLESKDAFVSALKQVKGNNANVKAVVVPMKLEGGLLNYASNISYVAGMGICDGSLTASEIVSIAKEEGFSVYALISVLDDCQFPELHRDAGIQLADGTGRWLDNSPEKGGKPWMSPYSSKTVSYMTAMIQELENAGFSAAICQNFVYPSFYESDRNFIDVDDYFGENRNDAMVALADAMVEAATGNMTVVLDME